MAFHLSRSSSCGFQEELLLFLSGSRSSAAATGRRAYGERWQIKIIPRALAAAADLFY